MRPTLRLKINTDYSAFDDALASETARILRDVATKLEDGRDFPMKLLDVNGNVVGRASFA